MLGTNIADLRKRNSLTQEELAEKLAVSRQTLAKWERGESDPDIQSVIRLSELFQVSLDDLVHYDKRENLGMKIPPKGRTSLAPRRWGSGARLCCRRGRGRCSALRRATRCCCLATRSAGWHWCPGRRFSI